MKRVLCFLLTVVMACTMLGALTVSAASEIYYDGTWHTYTGNLFKLKVNGKTLDCSVPPIVFHDYSVVPARDVFEHLGAEVLWDGANEKVTVNYQNTKIVLYINNTAVYKNSKVESMPIAPKIINGKTMIPVRYVAESLGFDVGFDSKTDTISITTKKTTTTTPTPTPTPEAPVYTVKLQSYSYKETDEGFTAKLTLSSSKVTYSSFALKEPDRVVVDIKSTNMAGSIKNAEFTSGMVAGIRFGLNNEGLRVVFDLSAAQEYKVSRSGKVLTVTIGDTTAVPEEPEETPTVTTPTEPEEVIEIEPSRSITIDAGHGGSDPGAIYTDEDGTIWRETDINLGVALKVRDILEDHGVRVVMTRTTEKDVVRRSRPELANEEKTALFISIHTNSVAENDQANGIETWGSLETSKALAGVTDKEFARNVQSAVIDKTDARDRGIKDSVDLTVLVYSVMPSVLIEVGFITNEEERENMFSESYRNKLAEGIAEGILKTFEDMGV